MKRRADFIGGGSDSSTLGDKFGESAVWRKKISRCTVLRGAKGYPTGVQYKYNNEFNELAYSCLTFAKGKLKTVIRKSQEMKLQPIGAYAMDINWMPILISINLSIPMQQSSTSTVIIHCTTLGHSGGSHPTGVVNFMSWLCWKDFEKKLTPARYLRWPS